jgi:hypothetical protein
VNEESTRESTRRNGCGQEKKLLSSRTKSAAKENRRGKEADRQKENTMNKTEPKTTVELLRAIASAEETGPEPTRAQQRKIEQAYTAVFERIEGRKPTKEEMEKIAWS